MAALDPFTLAATAILSAATSFVIALAKLKGWLAKGSKKNVELHDIRKELEAAKEAVENAVAALRIVQETGIRSEERITFIAQRVTSLEGELVALRRRIDWKFDGSPGPVYP